jgi:hypothetical protein
MKTTVETNPVVRWMNVEELRSLLAPHAPPCVSIYHPTHAQADDKQHYEGLLRRARTQLAKQATQSEIDDVLGALEALYRPHDGQHGPGALAVFRSKDHEAVYRLPMALPERLVVADSFHVRPMLEFLQANQRFFLLVLSQGRVSFFSGSMAGLVPVDLRSMPRSLIEALGVEEGERLVKPHSSAYHGTAAIYAGCAGDDNSRDEDLARFFRIVDQELMKVLRDENAPLVVAAPDRQFGIYASVSRYPHLLAEGLHGQFASAGIQELHQRAWPKVEEFVKERESVVLEHYSAGISRRRSSDEISFIARAVVQGRVRELLLARGATLWGRFDVQTGALDLTLERRDQHDEDVLDDLAEAVMLRGGGVFSFEPGRMPSGSPVAATLRW